MLIRSTHVPSGSTENISDRAKAIGPSPGAVAYQSGTTRIRRKFLSHLAIRSVSAPACSPAPINAAEALYLTAIDVAATRILRGRLVTVIGLKFSSMRWVLQLTEAWQTVRGRLSGHAALRASSEAGQAFQACRLAGIWQT
jgi:hypothetical protein